MRFKSQAQRKAIMARLKRLQTPFWFITKPKFKGLTENAGIVYSKNHNTFYHYFSDKLSYYKIKNDKTLRKKYLIGGK